MGAKTGQQQPTSATRKEQRAESPPLFKVLMHNDDYTTMEFVLEVLQQVFRKPSMEAEQLMLTIHFQGVAHCGTYPFAIAETKTEQVRVRARQAGYPLRCSLEEV